MKKLILLILFLPLLVCSPSKTSEQDKILEQNLEKTKSALEESKKVILANKKPNYTVQFGSSTPEMAVVRFLKKISESSSASQNPFLFSQQENELIMYPNTYGYGTSLDVTPLKEYNQLLQKLTDLGYSRIKESIGSNKIKSIQVTFGKERVYDKIYGFKPSNVTILLQNGSKLEIEQIKMVFKVGNQFKVGVIAP